MKNNILLVFLLLTAINGTLTAQNEFGEIRGKLTDSVNLEPVPFASIIAYMDGTLISGATTDIEGYFSIKPLQSGSYQIKTSSQGYSSLIINDVKVNSGKMTFLTLKCYAVGITLPGPTISTFTTPLIDPGQISTMQVLGTEEIRSSPYMDVKQLAATTAGVYQEDEGESIYMRGAREDGTAYYIDGIKVIGDFRLPKTAIKEMKVLTGGIPASIGDVTGGVIMITTKGYSKW